MNEPSSIIEISPSKNNRINLRVVPYDEALVSAIKGLPERNSFLKSGAGRVYFLKDRLPA